MIKKYINNPFLRAQEKALQSIYIPKLTKKKIKRKKK